MKKCSVEKKGKILIDSVEGSLEWHNNADHRKDRGDHNRAKSSLAEVGEEKENIQPIAVSTAMDRHYTALTKKLEYLKSAGTLMAADKFIRDAFQMGRTVRDEVLYAPQKSSGEIKKILITTVKKAKGSEELTDQDHEFIEASVMEIRQTLKKILTQSLREISEESIRRKAQ